VNVTLTRPLEGNDAVLTIADDGRRHGRDSRRWHRPRHAPDQRFAAQLQGSISMKRGDGVTFELKFPVELMKAEG